MATGCRSAAKASTRQAQLRVVQLHKEFEELVTQITRDARSNAHVVNAAKEKFDARKQAMALAQKELQTIETRAKLLVEGDEVGRLYLDDILQTQERLAVAQAAFQVAQVDCIVAHFELERATGQILNSQHTQGSHSLPTSQFPQMANLKREIPTRPKSKYQFLQPGKMFATSRERK